MVGEEMRAALDDEHRVRQARRALRISAPGRERIEAVARLARGALDVPVASVNVVSATEVRPLVSVGAEAASAPREQSPCTVVVALDEPVVVSDARDDDRLRRLGSITGDPHVRFYAAYPVRMQGLPVGTMCLWGTEPRALGSQEQRLLADLAGFVETQIELDQDAVEAREVQRRLLPREAPVLGDWQVAGRCLPTRAIGGDLYDWRSVPASGEGRAEDQVQVSVCDVMGKGITAAVTASGVRAVLRGTARLLPLETTLARVEESLVDDVAPGAEEEFSPVLVTMFAARLATDGGVEWIDAGHGLACIVGADGSFRELASGEVPLGVGTGPAWTARTDHVAPGEALVVVSDGVLGSGADLRHLAPVLAAMWRAATDATALVDRLVALGEALASRGTSDDITALVAARPAE